MRERFQTFGLSLVRRGVFVRHTRRFEQVGDASTAHFEQPGFEQVVTHPVRAHGSTTVLVLADAAMGRYAGDTSMPDRPIPVTADVQVKHVALLAALRAGIDEAELDVRLTRLIGRLVETDTPGRLSARRPATARSHRRIVDHVREAIASDPATLDLQALAADLGHTSFHVSRVFRRMTGMTLIRYRNEIRIAAAIDRIAEGQDRYVDLAAELGFADQSHFTRVLARAVRLSPARLRRRLDVPALPADKHVQDMAGFRTVA
jgi:AraC-like DNA-binding protein